MENEHNGHQHAPHGEQQGPEKNVLMGILAYIGPLIIVSFLLAKDDPFVKFHIKQGLLLVIIEVATWMLMTTLWILFPILQIVNLAVLVLAVIGIVNAAKGHTKELPLVGSYAKHFSF